MRDPGPAAATLAGIRRGGTITELLFLYECTTVRPTRLRPIARSLGLTVQAASHCFRQLRDRGLVELVDGQYRPTVRGVSWLHRLLGGLREDIDGRLSGLRIVRSTRAVAGAAIAAGAPVVLSLEDGLLTARPGAGGGGSRGRARTARAAGELVEVDGLEGIVPIEPGRILVLTLASGDAEAPGFPEALAARLAERPGGLWAALGIEAVHALRRVTDRPIARFAVAAAGREASRLGVDATIVVTDRELPRLLEELKGPELPPLEVRAALPPRRARPGGRRAPRGAPPDRPPRSPPPARAVRRAPGPARP